LIAIITARGGSKRIPRKNIREFCGKPIIAYSIETALNSKLFDEVMVSTDDAEIAEISKKYGATVPFMRSQKNSNDHSTTADVLEEVLLKYLDLGMNFKVACCIYPTAPLLKIDFLKKANEFLNQEKVDSVFPILKFSFPIQRALKADPSMGLSMFYPENRLKRSQDLEPAYHDAGQFYFFKIKKFLETKNLYSENCRGVLLDELDAQDIDNEDDWKLAEFKYKYNRIK
jgi:N-acylneuraminate cytidylyltransferase